jgi:desulfoferrodoxin-like iron-binding protein
MKVFICTVCGLIEFGEAPQHCPVCHVPAEKFQQNDTVFKEAEEKSKEAAVKHIPAITVNKKCGLIPESSCTDVIVRIGKTLHPMEEKHSILFIDCYIDDKFSARVYLTPALNAAACFHLKAAGSTITIVEKCNLHGYWMAQANLA